MTDPARTALTDALLEHAARPAGWDGHDARALTPAALARAYQVLARLPGPPLPPPSRLVPDVTGGVALYWFGTALTEGGGHRLAASIKVDPEGDLFLSRVDRMTEQVDVTEVSLGALGAAADVACAFVAGGCS